MKLLKQIFCTKIGWFIICWLLFTILLFIGVPDWVLYIIIAYPLGLVITAIVYAWVINPLNRKR